VEGRSEDNVVGLHLCESSCPIQLERRLVSTLEYYQVRNCFLVSSLCFHKLYLCRYTVAQRLSSYKLAVGGNAGGGRNATHRNTQLLVLEVGIVCCVVVALLLGRKGLVLPGVWVRLLTDWLRGAYCPLVTWSILPVIDRCF
jgi:hypothetical protein